MTTIVTNIVLPDSATGVIIIGCLTFLIMILLTGEKKGTNLMIFKQSLIVFTIPMIILSIYLIILRLVAIITG